MAIAGSARAPRRATCSTRSAPRTAGSSCWRGGCSRCSARRPADVAALRQTLNTAEPGVFRLEYGQLMRSIDGCCARPSCRSCSTSSPTCSTSGLPTRFGELAPRRPAEIVIHDVADAAPPRTGPIDSFGGSALTGELDGQRAQLRSRGRARDTLTLDAQRPHGRRANRRGAGRRPRAGDVRRARARERRESRRGRRSTPGDDLAGDDRRYLAIKRPSRASVLIVAPISDGRGALFTSVGARDA